MSGGDSAALVLQEYLGSMRESSVRSTLTDGDSNAIGDASAAKELPARSASTCENSESTLTDGV